MPSPRYRILCVDDDHDTCEVLELSNPYLRFTFAHTFASGLEYIRGGPFDLYVLDSWLPDGSGLDLCREIRRTDSTTPVVFLSAAAYVQDHQRAIEEGASAYLDKPTDLYRIEAVMNSLIWEAETKSLGAKVAAVSVLREDVEQRCLELAGQTSINRERMIRADEQVLRARAYSAFRDSGGLNAHFERLWPNILDEILAAKAANSE